MRLALVVLAALTCSCQPSSELGPGSSRVCNGEVLGTAQPSEFRRGFCAATTLELQFAPATGRCTPPTDRAWAGFVTTSDGLFDCAPLEEIAPLTNDALSDYDFPSGGRLRNFLYAIRRSAGAYAGTDATAFVSLLTDGRVELRLLAGGTPTGPDLTACTADTARASRDVFGVFTLRCR